MNTFLEKYSNIKFHKNPSSWNRGVQCRQTDLTKLIAPFCVSADSLKRNMYYCSTE